jgi:hypothetical protein
MKFYTEKDLEKGYRVYKELYKKQNKKEKMFGKMLSEYQWRSEVLASEGKSLASVSKSIISADRTLYDFKTATRKRNILVKNKVWLSKSGYKVSEINIEDVRRGKYDLAIDELTAEMKANRKANGVQISQYYYGSP